MRRERADPSASVDLGAMRAEIGAMSRSLADLAPRNAVVALEGAIRDLVQRVEMLRQNGQGESMLAPLEAMAAEFRAALRAHDPQPAVAALEREIRAIGGKVEIRPMMYLALSYDHRVIDGKDAVTYLVRVKEGLEDPARLVLDL